jgi:hypothetical protein
MENEELAKRLSDVKQCLVPDFGVQDTSLIDEIIGVKDRVLVAPVGEQSPNREEPETKLQRPNSLWWLFYDCIAKFPKFEQLKNFINESHRLKEFQNDQKRRKEIEAYFKRLEAQ